MQPVTMVSAGCRAPRRVLFDARRFNALAFSRDSLPLASVRSRTHTHAFPIYAVHARNARQWSQCRSLVYTFTWVARTTITDASSRRAVKASQSSFHRCSLHGRVGNIRGDSKGNQIRGKANERPGHARHIHNIGAYVCTYVKLNGKTHRGPCDEFLERSRERCVPAALPRGTSVFGLSPVTPHKPLSYTIPIPYLARP